MLLAPAEHVLALSWGMRLDDKHKPLPQTLDDLQSVASHQTDFASVRARATEFRTYDETMLVLERFSISPECDNATLRKRRSIAAQQKRMRYAGWQGIIPFL